MRTFRLCSLAALLLVVATCSQSDLPSPIGPVEFSGLPGGGEPNLFATSDGRVLLSWHEPTEGGGSALRMAVRTMEGWSEPKTIAEDRSFFVNWADFPSLIELTDGSLLAHWLEKTAKSTYAYHVMLSSSTDGGVTWSEPVRPHRDMSPKEHGFVSMLPLPDGGAAILWLDGRAMAGGAGSGGHSSGSMSVRFTTMASGGTFGEELLLDDRTCECCQTAMVRTDDGNLVAAYRDRSDQEIRDIAVARLVDGKWSQPYRVGDDNWHFTACPVNGPSLSTAGSTVVIAWFSAPNGESRAAVAFSRDGAVTFGDPVRIDDGNPLGRVDIELLDGGAALVIWLEKVGGAAEIRARRVEASGVVGRSWTVAHTSQARRSGFPRMAHVGDEMVFAWTDVEGGVRVAAATIGQ